MTRPGLIKPLVAAAVMSAALLVFLVFLQLRNRPGPSSRGAIDELRALYLAHEFETGRRKGEALVAEYQTSSEVAAWYALHAARAGATDEAMAAARGLLEREPRNPWSHFALAGALIHDDDRGDEALAASETALAVDPGHHDFLWMRAETLRLRNRKQEAIALLDASAALERSAELLVVKGAALYDQWLVAFRLKTLAGAEITSESLRGKVAVITFWGLWCGPCLVGLPELVALARKYRDADGAEILTINNDPNPEQVREWLSRNGHDIPVLIDDGYWEAAGIRAVPATWFLDRSGARAFDAVGLVPSVAAESSARIEALREPSRSSSRASAKQSAH